MKRRVLCIVLCLSLCLSAFAVGFASPGSDYAKNTSGNYITNLYNSQTGLPANECNDIAQSGDGFIWFGCYSGLICYDGVNFERIEYDGLSSINVLFIDNEGRLWIGTNDNGIALRISNSEFRVFNKESGLRSSSVRSICQYDDGTLLIGTTEGVYTISPDFEVKPINDERINSKYINSLVCTGPSSCAGVTTNGEVFTVNKTKVDNFVEYTEQYPQPISAAVDSEGNLWIGTDSNLILKGKVENSKPEYEEIETGDLENINNIFFCGDKPWICSDSGIGFMDNGEVSVLNCEMMNSVDSMTEDREGNLWFASSRQGVLRLTENHFTDIFKSAGLDEAVVNSTLVENNILYIGTDNGLLAANLSDNSSFTDKLTETVGDARVRCVIKDKSNTIWVCTYNGLFSKTKDGQVASYTTEEGMTTTKVRSAIVLSDGRLAVATSAGLNIIDHRKVTEKYTTNEGLKNEEVLSLCEKPDGDILLGTDGGGIFILHNGKISQVEYSEGSLVSDVVMRIVYDKSHDGYWLVTGSALLFYDGRSIIDPEKFPYDNNFDVILGENDSMMVLSSGGLYVVDRKNLLSNEPLDYALYKYDNGLVDSVTANSFPYYDDNIIYLCCSKGVFAMQRNSNSTQSVPQIIIPRVFSDGTEIPVERGRVEIPSSCNKLVIDCYALTYTLQDPTISYRLDGIDSENNVVLRSDMGEIRYTNIPGGEYTFDFSVIDSISGESIASMSILITKKKLITEMAVFYILAALILAGILALVFALINRRKLETANRKQLEARKLTGQIITTFSKVIDAKDKYTNGHSKRVAEYSREIARAMNFDEEEVENVFNIAMLHDIGKLGIPDEILNKKGPLDDDEFKMMKTHTEIGADILSEIEILPEIALGARYHHERFSGRGYMAGLQGKDIPLIARIISVADAFDAMNSTRVYRKNLTKEKIVSEIEKGSGTQFDPDIASVLLKLIEDGTIKMEDD